MDVLFTFPLEDGFTTDVTPEKEDVEADFDTMRRQVKIKSYASKWVTRKYTFGFNGAAADIPDGEFEWLKVSYGFAGIYLSLTTTSPSNSHSFQIRNCLMGTHRILRIYLEPTQVPSNYLY